jgi:hypothetical protein
MGFEKVRNNHKKTKLVIEDVCISARNAINNDKIYSFPY